MTALAGKWTYRSFHNNPAPVTDSAETALGLFFAEVDVTLSDAPGDKLTGGIDWPGGGLDFAGVASPATVRSPLTVHIIGSGRPSTGTDGWEYDYHGHLAHPWPKGRQPGAGRWWVR